MMKNFKKVFSLMVIGVLVVSFAVMIPICNGKGSPAKTKIVYWHWDGNPVHNPAFQELIKRFMAKNPKIEVEYVGFPVSSYFQKYNVAIATNSTPDAAGIKGLDAAGFYSQRVLEPLDKRFNSWNEKRKIDKKILKIAKDDSPDGKLYILPFFKTTEAIWYNKKLFTQNNIQAPKTINDFMALCKKYADPQKGKYFYSLRGGSGSAENLFTFLFTYAGVNNFFDKAGNCVLTKPKFIKGLETYASIYWNNWVAKDSITNSYKEMVAEFGSGTSMYIMHNSSSLPEHLKNLGQSNIMMGFHLTGANGVRVVKAPTFGGPVMFKKSKNKDAAWKLMSYLASAQGASYLCEKVGTQPVNSLVYDDAWVKNNPFMSISNEEAKARNTKYVVLPQWLPQWFDFKTKIQEPDLQALLLKKKTSKEILTRWATVLTQYQKEYLKSRK